MATFRVGPHLNEVLALAPTSPGPAPGPNSLAVSFELQQLPGVIPVFQTLGGSAAPTNNLIRLAKSQGQPRQRTFASRVDSLSTSINATLREVSPQKLVLAPLLVLSDWTAEASRSAQELWAASSPWRGDSHPDKQSSARGSGTTGLPADVACFTLAGHAPGYKDANQDACFAYVPFGNAQQLLLGVFDGHGLQGHHVSDLAKRFLPPAIFNGLISMSSSPSPAGTEPASPALYSRNSSISSSGPASLPAGASSPSMPASSLLNERSLYEEAFRSVDEQLALSGIDVDNSGSTAVVVHLNGSKLTTAWVGDSRAVLAARTRTVAPERGADSGTSSSCGGFGMPWLQSIATIFPVTPLTWLSSAVGGWGSSSGANASSGTGALSSGSGSLPGAASSSVVSPLAFTAGSPWTPALDLSDDHKPENATERRRIALSGGRVAKQVGSSGHPQGPFRVWMANADFPGLAMSRALGDRPARMCGVSAVPDVRVWDLPALLMQLVGNGGSGEERRPPPLATLRSTAQLLDSTAPPGSELFSGGAAGGGTGTTFYKLPASDSNTSLASHDGSIAGDTAADGAAPGEGDASTAAAADGRASQQQQQPQQQQDGLAVSGSGNSAGSIASNILGSFFSRQQQAQQHQHQHQQRQGPAVRHEVLLVLASDGVWEFMSSQEAVAVAGSHTSAAEGCKALVREARRRWEREYGGAYIDDITAVVARLDCTDLMNLSQSSNRGLSSGGGGGSARISSSGMSAATGQSTPGGGGGGGGGGGVGSSIAGVGQHASEALQGLQQHLLRLHLQQQQQQHAASGELPMAGAGGVDVLSNGSCGTRSGCTSGSGGRGSGSGSESKRQRRRRSLTSHRLMFDLSDPSTSSFMEDMALLQ